MLATTAPINLRQAPPWNAVLKAGVIYSKSRRTAVWLWGFAILWTALSLPTVIRHWHDAPGPGYRSPHLLLAIFPAATLLLLASAMSNTLQATKFGRSMLTITPLPPHPGEPLQMIVAIPRRLAAESICTLDLQCVHRTRSRGAHDDSMETIAWQDDRTARTASDGETTRITADFALPPEAEPTTGASVDTAVIWRLIVHAQLPGVDYRERFELPVFDRQPGDAPALISAAAPGAVARSPSTDIALASELGHQRIWLQTFAGGAVQVDFPPARHVGSMLAFAAFGALCFFPLLIVPQDDLLGKLFIIPFVLFGLALGLVAIGGIVGSTRLTADRDGVVVVRRFLGLPFTRRLKAADIVSITARQTMTSGNSAYYSLNIGINDDPYGCDIGSGIGGHATADRLAAAVKVAVKVAVPAVVKAAVPAVAVSQ